MNLRLPQAVPRLKIQHVAFITVFLCFILVNADKIHDPDMWWHLKVGGYIVENREVPQADFYSFSNEGHHWIAHEWGSEVIYYLSYKLWKFRGLFMVNLIFLSLTYYMLGRLIHTRANRDLSVTTVVIIVCTVFSSIFWVFRPHLMAYLFFIGYIYILEEYVRGRNLLWLLPLIMVLWVNMHGSFIMGIVLIGIYLLAGLVNINFGRLLSVKWEKNRLKTLILVLVLAAAAVVINPNTVKMYYYPFFTMNSKAIVENITEWASPDFHNPVFKAFLAYLFLVYTTMMISRKPVKLHDTLLLGLFTYLAMFGARNIALFMFITGPVWAEHLSGFLVPARPQKQVTALNWLILLAALTYGIYAFPAQMTIDDKVNRERFPDKAVQYMKDHNLNGTIFNNYNWGGYLIWTRYPANKPFIDGRSDIYEDRVLPDYMDITKLRPGAYELLKKYNPDYILMPPEAPINHLLMAKGDWQIVYSDKVALLYGKKKQGP